MSARNRGTIMRLTTDIARFASGEIELDEMQAELQAALALLERDGGAAAEAVRLAEADVEEIRFAVLFRLDRLREILGTG
jgi:hypothetical protein